MTNKQKYWAKSVCCLCGKVLKEKYFRTDIKNNISHGYCIPCKDKELKRLKLGAN